MQITSDIKVSEKTEIKLSSFSRLHEGWKNGRGGPVSLNAFRVASKINAIASWFKLETDAFMGIDNDVTIAVYHKLSDYSFHVSSRGLITFDSELQDIPQEIGLSIDDCLAKINLIASSECKLSYFYTLLTSTPGSGDFGAWHSNRLAMGAESLPSLWIVSPTAEHISAHMPDDTTQTSPQSLQFSGALTLASSPMAIQ
jgi:hypothetical protein